jgi:ribonuclease R
VPKAAAKASASSLPTEAQILEFIGTAEGRVGKREIARAFGIKGNGRVALKQLLKKLEADGRLARKANRLADTTRLPPVAVLEIADSDEDGELIAIPVEWDETQGKERPRVFIAMRKAKGAREDLRPPGRGDRVLAKIEPTGERGVAYRATIIRRLTDRASRVLGIYRIAKGHGARIVPVDKKARNELQVLAGDDAGAAPGELIEAEIVKDRGRGLVSARVRKRLGDLNDQRNMSLIAIRQHGIPDVFPDKVSSETAALKPLSPANRLDLRNVPLITIDPRDARDHDDAVWATPDDDPANEGGVQVIVAIADVAAYVRPDTALDREARIRGNSVYFPDRVVPMLPERISNDLCSLREGEDRPCLACFMTFDKSGTKKKHRFARAVMRSAAKLAYEEAQAAIDGRTNDKTGPLIEPVLRPLWDAYRVLSKGRNRRGPLELDLPERKLILDAHGLIERVVTPERLDAHRLVEEFMIQANVAAAESLEQRKTPLIYRIHEAPSAEKVRALGEFLQTIGMSLPKGQTMTPKHFNRILTAVEGKEYQHVVNEVVLRTQAQAVYSPENRGHFGLHLRRYAHFTSPIRRYADLIVHRALIAAFDFGNDGLSPNDVKQIEETAEMISAAERRAMAAERETVDRLIASHLAGQTGALFRGRIGGVVGAGLFVTLNDTGADGFVPVATLGREYFVFDDKRHALVGERSGETFQLGDPVDVRLVEVTPVSGGLRFEMASEGRAGKPISRRPPRIGAKHPGRGRR